MTIEKNIKKDTCRSYKKYRYILAAGFILPLIIVAFTLWLLTWTPKYDSENDKIIIQAVAKQLNKEPNSLTNEDYARITELDLPGKQISNLAMLKKFRNLEKLNLERYRVKETEAPKWMKILAKLGVYNLSEKCVIDLSPLAKLPDFKSLNLENSYFSNIKHISIIKNLQELNLAGNNISDIEPLKELKKLKILDLRRTRVANIKALEGLKELESLNIVNTQVTDLEPLTKLANLKILHIYANVVTDLEPIKKMTNLKVLDIGGNGEKLVHQVEELKKTMPNLEVQGIFLL